MLKNQWWLTVLLIVGLLFVNANGVFANTNDEDEGYMQRSEIEHFMEITSEDGTEQSMQMITELAKYLEEHEEYLFEEVASIVDKYRVMKTTKDTNAIRYIKEVDQESLQRDFERIDALAREYYDYYQIHNEFPKEESSKVMTIRSIATSEALTVLSNAGIRMTERQLAARLAALGVIAAIDGPLPVGDFIALVTGAVIISDYLNDYVARKDRLARDIGNNEGRSFIKVVTESLVISETVAYEIKKNKIKHFRAFLNPVGGVIVGDPLTLSEARLLARQERDTFSVRKDYAEKVVTQPNFKYVYEDPHYTDGRGRIKLANLPHFHLMGRVNGSWDRLEGHHFFPWVGI
ncbi:hypothetical protein NDK47_24665 [Brevibacillus ruminantium]|uniref:HNH endonuclease n=1 Tax=Brevibacillus ruminantium TaxID=2950604 RepID=A0ABY4WDK9_9BACL|nr:hypothetical protein [Brevibacillus ruminantium]USG65263.1 hypothetical protein NDK47_24665 [Brevibacillus ruminantium]